MAKKKSVVEIKTIAFPDGTYFELPKPINISTKFVGDGAMSGAQLIGFLVETLRLECEALTGEIIPVISSSTKINQQTNTSDLNIVLSRFLFRPIQIIRKIEAL